MSDVGDSLGLADEGISDHFFTGAEEVSVVGQFEKVHEAFHSGLMYFQAAIGEDVVYIDTPFGKGLGD